MGNNLPELKCVSILVKFLKKYFVLCTLINIFKLKIEKYLVCVSIKVFNFYHTARNLFATSWQMIMKQKFIKFIARKMWKRKN